MESENQFMIFCILHSQFIYRFLRFTQLLQSEIEGVLFKCFQRVGTSPVVVIRKSHICNERPPCVNISYLILL